MVALLQLLKSVNFRPNGLIHSQKWLVGFSLSGEIVLWDQGEEVWVREDGHSPYPLGVCSPDMPLDWMSDGDEDEVRPSRFWMPLKRNSIGLKGLGVLRSKGEKRC